VLKESLKSVAVWMIVIESQALPGEAPLSKKTPTDLTREEICSVGKKF
jgi:hypothetical protein